MNHPIPAPPPASPEIRVPDLREVIRQATEEILLAAQRTHAQRDQLTQDAAYDFAQDREDERAAAEAQQAIEEAQRALEEIRSRRSQRRARITERSAAIQALEAQLAHLEAEGRRGNALYDGYGQAAATLTDGQLDASGTTS